MPFTKADLKSRHAYVVPAMLKNLSYKLTSALSSSEVPTLKRDGEFSKATKTEQLFPTTDPAIDGEECLHDCDSCSVKYPRKFEIDETEELYGHVKGFNTHLIVATGKTDWVRDVADETGSIMEAVDKGDTKPNNGVSNTIAIASSNSIQTDRHTETHALRLRHARPQPLRPQLHGPAPTRLAIHRQRHTREYT
jgi:hypothetical protein